jgi:FkbM family methyltransferase
MIRRALAATPVARSKRFARSLPLVACPNLVRLGSAYGGWTIPADLIRSDSVCYSGGIGTDVSFDLELIRRYRCAVHAFDPTPSSVDYVQTAGLPAEFRFFPYALCRLDGERTFHFYNARDGSYSINLSRTGDSFVAQCRSVRSVMQEFGHARLDLLKLDIEGAEYEVIDSLLTDGIDVSVLCVEFHRTPLIRRMVRSARRLQEGGFVPVALSYFDVTFMKSDLLDL